MPPLSTVFWLLICPSFRLLVHSHENPLSFLIQHEMGFSRKESFDTRTSWVAFTQKTMFCVVSRLYSGHLMVMFSVQGQVNASQDNSTYALSCLHRGPKRS
ncbi:hypothetical protein IWZ00DRAFT_500852 [Phyllosticta capitalensis]